MRTMFFGYNFGRLSLAITNGTKPEREDWREIDPNTLSPDAQDAYLEYKDAYRLAKEAKAKFEALVRDQAGFVPAAKPVAKSSKATSLADFVSNRAANGLAV